MANNKALNSIKKFNILFNWKIEIKILTRDKEYHNENLEIFQEYESFTIRKIAFVNKKIKS